MLRRKLTIPILVVVLAATGVVRADLQTTPSDALRSLIAEPTCPLGPDGLGIGASRTTEKAAPRRVVLGPVERAQAAASPLASHPVDRSAPCYRQAALDDETTVLTVPPAPSSLKLILSGLVSLGAVQLARSMRQVHFAALPEWYHTACPDRVGIAVPLELDHATPPLCVFDRPVAEPDRATHPRPVCVAVWQPVYETVLTLTAPRSPPRLS